MASLCLSKAVPGSGKQITRIACGWASNSKPFRYRAATYTTLRRIQPRTSFLVPKEGPSRALSFWERRMAAQAAAPLVWIDCEMTGLDPDKEEIIEIFCLITYANLELMDPEGWGTVIHQPKERLDQMDDWCIQTHGGSGLTAAVIASEVTAEKAADELLAYIKKFVPEPRTALLAGNSVHADKAFLSKEPYRKVVDFLHYRILDVSTIKEAAIRWSPKVIEGSPRKKMLHKAKDDILESIEEARFYKQVIFERR